MKKIFGFIVFITFYSFVIQAQEVDLLKILPMNENTKKVEYTEVVKVEGTPAELYTRGLMWINSFFKNASEVTRVRDENNGVIEGLHRLRLMNTLEDGAKVLYGYVQYEFKLEFKDGRYRYKITDYVFKDQSRQPIEKFLDIKSSWYTSNTVSHLEQIDVFTKDLIASLKKGMEPKVEVKDEW